MKIKEKLISKYRFKTDSDTEAILHLYREKKTACVSELNGMFAFALFDGEDVMLARDPIGIKPLYYGYHGESLFFASELGAMTLAGVEEVHEFPAGHYFTPQEGFVQFYQVPVPQVPPFSDIERIGERIRHTVIKAVKDRLLADSDVPVGSFCSGGLDSSIVAAIAAESIPHLHTFAVGMKDESGCVGDDIAAARRAADHIGSTHHELLFTEADYVNALPQVIKKLETYDPALVRCAVPCFFTCKLAAEHVTVALTGEGADELFAGYHYMKRLPPENINEEARRLVDSVHNINLQRADRMGMLFGLELRVPFFDLNMIDLSMKIPPHFKIGAYKGKPIEKWILRKAFEKTGYLPEEILWRYKVQYTQGAGCESVGEKLAEHKLSDEDVERIKAENPGAVINSKEAAYYFKIFSQYHPQKSIINSIGIWQGFDFDEERKQVQGTISQRGAHPAAEKPAISSC